MPPAADFAAQLSRLPRPTADAPLPILVSACFLGHPVDVDGTAYGPYDSVARLAALPTVRLVPACAEHHAFGAPRRTPDIHGGDGFAVLRGEARVLADREARTIAASGAGVAGSASEPEQDLTSGMIAGAREVLRVARAFDVQLAVLMDVSAACGSTVIYDGHRADRVHQRGYGVTAALLVESGVLVISQRDLRAIEQVLAHCDPTHAIDPGAIDHHEGEWYRSYFG